VTALGTLLGDTVGFEDGIVDGSKLGAMDGNLLGWNVGSCGSSDSRIEGLFETVISLEGV
jgi:hypothetical protein